MIYFTSDQHFFHRNIIKYCNRPYNNVHEMNVDLISRFNSVVSKNDTTYHLGDFSLYDKKIPDILPILNGTHILISGNHDKCHPYNKNSFNNYFKYIEFGFKDVVTNLITIFNDIGAVLLSHLPPHSDMENDKFKNFRPIVPSFIKLCLTGHVHEKWKKQNNCINVGVDQWNYFPVSLNQLIKMD